MLKILLFLTLSLNAYSQQITGTISDQSSQQPIPYASIYYKNTDIGTYADATGKFKIPKLIDTLIISALGYEKQIYPINHNTTTININLQPNIIHLNEISISANKKTHKTSGKKLEKDWQMRPPKKQLNKTYFEEPNFSISVLAY